MSLSTSPPALPDGVQPEVLAQNHACIPEANRPLPVAIPVFKTDDTAAEFATEHRYSHKKYMDLANDIKHCAIGPMPIKEFLEFLPPSDSTYEHEGVSQLAKIGEKPETKKENEIHRPFFDAAKKVLFNSGMVLVDTSSAPEVPDRGSLKPDITMYSATLPSDCYRRQKGSNYANFGLAELVIEIKMNDPFYNSDPSAPDAKYRFVLGDPTNEKLRKSNQDLGQNVAYAVEIQRRQHRLFCFTVMVINKMARLLRWDRAGVIVSEAFSYTASDSNFLAEFLWRYAKASPSERGYDTSVKAASKKQEDLFCALVQQRLERDLREGALAPKTDINALLSKHYQANCVSATSVNGDTYLICFPVISPEGLACRGTRGYWAVAERTKSVVFLKDTWRAVVKGIDLEGDILFELNKHHVPHIPRLETHELIANGSTLTDQFAELEWVIKSNDKESKSITPRHHYRIVVKEAGYRLSDLRGSHELFSATLDIHNTIAFADARAKAYHRDLSLGNIILMPEYLTVDPQELSVLMQDNLNISEKQNLVSTGESTSRQHETCTAIGALQQEPQQVPDSYCVRKGVLIDWELCSFYERHQGTRRDQRTGTWQFMSIAELKRMGNLVHNIYHELESLMWIVLYCTLKLLPHNCSDPRVLGETIRTIFDDVNISGEGGNGKVLEFSMAPLTSTITFQPTTFWDWYVSMRALLTAGNPMRYKQDTNPILDSWDCWEKALKDLVAFTSNRTEHDIFNDRPLTSLIATITSDHQTSSTPAHRALGQE